MDQMMEMLVKHADNLEDLVNERTRLLYEEKMKTEDLLHRMLPKYVCSIFCKTRSLRLIFLLGLSLKDLQWDMVSNRNVLKWSPFTSAILLDLLQCLQRAHLCR